MGSRVHKIGSIYSRMEQLLLKQGGTDFKKPLWFDLYTRFPPDREPTFRNKRGQEVSKEKVPEIFYPEDLGRAAIQKVLGHRMEPVDLLSQDKGESQMQKWLKTYNDYISQGYSESDALKELVRSQGGMGHVGRSTSASADDSDLQK